MIQKKIHYIWFGRKPKSTEIQTCMKSWKRHLSDYEFIEWSEDNFDINSHPYTKKAYEQKKWAYVSDYVRAYALYNHGGIYLDTDVMVLDSFNSLLQDRAFVGFENEEYPFTAVFGCEPKHRLAEKMLEMYDSTEFLYDLDDEYKNVNTKTVSKILVDDFDVKITNEKQNLTHGLTVYPDYVLCNPSKHSLAIHIFTGTWLEVSKPITQKIVTFLKLKLTNKRRANIYRKIVKLPSKIKS